MSCAGDDITTALGVLDRLGLIDYEPRGSGEPYRAVRVHPVLRRAVREALPADSTGTAVTTSRHAIGAPKFGRQLPHTDWVRGLTGGGGSKMAGKPT